jgi:hypothetical protein
VTGKQDDHRREPTREEGRKKGRERSDSDDEDSSEGYKQFMKGPVRGVDEEQISLSESDSDDRERSIPPWLRKGNGGQKKPSGGSGWQPVNQKISPFPMEIAVQPGRKKPAVKFVTEDDDDSEGGVPPALRRQGWY